jgi:hypothetical protein
MKRRVIRRFSKKFSEPRDSANHGFLKPHAMGHAMGMLSMIVLVFYGLFVWFSNYESAFIIAKYPIAFSFFDWTMLFGLVQSYVMFYVLGWAFAKLYNSV